MINANYARSSLRAGPRIQPFQMKSWDVAEIKNYGTRIMNTYESTNTPSFSTYVTYDIRIFVRIRYS